MNEWGKWSIVVDLLISWDTNQMYFSPRERHSGAFPLCVNPEDSLTRSMEEFMHQCIPQIFIEYLLCPG